MSEMRCPKCNDLMVETDYLHIEECLHCGCVYDWLKKAEVDPTDFEDDDDDMFADDDVYSSDEDDDEVFNGHKDVWLEVDGHRQRILGDPNMSEETKKSLADMIKLITTAIENGDFKKKVD